MQTEKHIKIYYYIYDPADNNITSSYLCCLAYQLPSSLNFHMTLLITLFASLLQ